MLTHAFISNGDIFEPIDLSILYEGMKKYGVHEVYITPVGDRQRYKRYIKLWRRASPRHPTYFRESVILDERDGCELQFDREDNVYVQFLRHSRNGKTVDEVFTDMIALLHRETLSRCSFIIDENNVFRTRRSETIYHHFAPWPGENEWMRARGKDFIRFDDTVGLQTANCK